jgi:heme A synthase
MTDHTSSRLVGLLSVSTALRVIAAAGLAFDARIHFKLASTYDAIKSSTISQGDLFRIEAVSAVIAAVAILVFARPLAGLAAAAVAGGGLVPLLVYRYYDIGSIGPLPPMYEPAWYPDKTNTAWAQAIATVAALVFVVIAVRKSRRKEPVTS